MLSSSVAIDWALLTIKCAALEQILHLLQPTLGFPFVLRRPSRRSFSVKAALIVSAGKIWIVRKPFLVDLALIADYRFDEPADIRVLLRVRRRTSNVRASILCASNMNQSAPASRTPTVIVGGVPRSLQQPPP
jgi:hypothetical protein